MACRRDYCSTMAPNYGGSQVFFIFCGSKSQQRWRPLYVHRKIWTQIKKGIEPRPYSSNDIQTSIHKSNFTAIIWSQLYYFCTHYHYHRILLKASKLKIEINHWKDTQKRVGKDTRAVFMGGQTRMEEASSWDDMAWCKCQWRMMVITTNPQK